MNKEYDEAVLVLDLRPKRRKSRRRAAEAGPQDGWTSHASPLEHRLMVEHGGAPDDWDAHLTRCDNCRRQTALVCLAAFAAEIRAEREGTE